MIQLTFSFLSTVKSITKQLTVWLLLFCTLVSLNSCGIYSLNGANIQPNIKTISINNFYNEAAGGPPNMSQSLTEKLKEYYQRNSTLKISNVEGDLQLQGAIVSYTLSPIAIAAQQPGQVDQAALNRLTIRVKAKFENTKDDSQNFDTDFSFYQDFPQSQNLTDVEGRIVPVILDQIVLDIFNKSVANW
ncbi:MAG: LptE family protein [Bacteroidota bacterium]